VASEGNPSLLLPFIEKKKFSGGRPRGGFHDSRYKLPEGISLAPSLTAIAGEGRGTGNNNGFCSQLSRMTITVRRRAGRALLSLIKGRKPKLRMDKGLSSSTMITASGYALQIAGRGKKKSQKADIVSPCSFPLSSTWQGGKKKENTGSR